MVSFAPAGLGFRALTFPTAYAVGCILAPLRGWTRNSFHQEGTDKQQNRKPPLLATAARSGAPQILHSAYSKIPTSRAHTAREMGHPIRNYFLGHFLFSFIADLGRGGRGLVRRVCPRDCGEDRRRGRGSH